MLSEARYYARMAWYFGRFTKAAPIADPEAAIRETLAHREENFLNLVRRGIFENPKSPYGELFRLADCTFEDLNDSVRQTGLEKTLQSLRVAGVYLTHEEVKGKPIQRHGKTIPNDIAATKNPGSPGGMESVSSGSRSSGTATPTSNEYRIYRECYETLAYRELGAKDRAVAFLRPILPSPNALTAMAGLARLGQPAERWFTVGKSLRTNGPYALATRLLVAEARLLGRRVPFPIFLDKDDFRPVARWVAESKRRGKPALVRSGVSWATRMCAAAIEESLDISGTVMIVGGEAISPARRKIFEAADVQAFGRYAISEFGTVGIGCPQLKGNSVHLLADALAVIEHRRPAPFVDAEVNSLLFTSVHPLASRVYINAEMEDAGTLVPATCDCGYSRVGFRTVIQNVYSFGKLSSQGMTLTGDALLSILEERLPERFGGGPGDYQLVEIEGAAQAELRLRVSPRLRSVDLGEVQGFFLEQVRRIYGGSLSVRTWESTSSIKAEAIEPYQTRTGKVHALHLAAFGGS
ncbi:MAG TPA: hypothetical protein VLM42_04155 [Bryobacteraceae bacterium]|nr:hypothetical protein [Bryobacteraceae bacterium]